MASMVLESCVTKPPFEDLLYPKGLCRIAYTGALLREDDGAVTVEMGYPLWFLEYDSKWTKSMGVWLTN